MMCHEFNIGECVVITVPKDSVYYRYLNGIVGSVIEYSNKYENRYLIQTDTGSLYLHEEFLRHIEEEEDIKIEDIFSII